MPPQPLTLKQRLAALSLAPSSPTGAGPSSPNSANSNNWNAFKKNVSTGASGVQSNLKGFGRNIGAWASNTRDGGRRGATANLDSDSGYGTDVGGGHGQSAADVENDRLDETIRRLIFQAGVDYEYV